VAKAKEVLSFNDLSSVIRLRAELLQSGRRRLLILCFNDLSSVIRLRAVHFSST
jgi:hypothetical protein